MAGYKFQSFHELTKEEQDGLAKLIENKDSDSASESGSPFDDSDADPNYLPSDDCYDSDFEFDDQTLGDAFDGIQNSDEEIQIESSYNKTTFHLSFILCKMPVKADINSKNHTHVSLFNILIGYFFV